MRIAQILFSASLSLILAVALAAPALAQEPDLVDEVVARVNNAVILLSAYKKAKKALMDEIKANNPNLPPEEIEKKYNEAVGDLLRTMIDEKLIEQKAAELNIEVEAQINEYMRKFAQENNIPFAQLEDVMRQNGIDPDEARANLRSQFLRDMVLRREVYGPIFNNITEPEQREFYQKHIDLFTEPAQYTLSEIFISFEGRPPQIAESLAREVVAQARSGGADFPSLVEKYSSPGRASRKNKGHIGTLTISQMADNIAKIVSCLKEGDVTEPIRMPDGYQIIRVDVLKPAQARDFDSVKGEIAQRLTFEKGQAALKKYLERLRKEAYINIADNYKDQYKTESGNGK